MKLIESSLHTLTLFTGYVKRDFLRFRHLSKIVPFFVMHNTPVIHADRQPEGVMALSANEESYDISYSLAAGNGESVLTLVPNQDWLTDPERVYPVVIDPSTETDRHTNSIQDTFVQKKHPNQSGVSQNGSFYVGDSYPYGVSRAYIRFPSLPALSKGDMVYYAKMYVWQREFSSEGQTLRISYDSKNRTDYVVSRVGTESTKTKYLYGNSAANEKAGLIYGVAIDDTKVLSYAYDNMARLSTRTLDLDTDYVTSYGYLDGNGAGTTTPLVERVQNGNTVTWYTYDAIGNITSISEGSTRKPAVLPGEKPGLAERAAADRAHRRRFKRQLHL